MNYKDRTHAKRKYKKALLTTVATMTLGISTLGSTSSAFAAENSISSQQAPSTPATTSDVFKVEKDGTIKILKDKLFTTDNLKAIGSLGGSVLKQAYADAHTNNGNFNNTFRTLTMGATALIPYGGVVISPLIGLLWPENVDAQKNQIKKMMEELATMMDQKIEDYDLGTLKQQTKALMNDLQSFEDSINGRPLAKSPTAGSIEETRRTQALIINAKFKDIIQLCQKEDQKIAELPIFTIIATAHLQFLHFMEKNGQSPKIQFDDESLKTQFTNDIPKNAEDYINHVQQTYKLGEQQFNKKMYDIATNTPSSNINNTSEEEVMGKMQKYIFDLHPLTNGYGEKIKKMQDALANYRKLRDDRNQYYKNTSNNKAFQVAAIGDWKQENNGWYFIDTKGNKKTGWIQLGEKHYYLSPSDGKMVTGSVDIKTSDGRTGTYQFNSSGECTNYDTASPNGTYKIVYSKANKVVDFGYDGKEHPVIWDYHDGKNQQWEFKYDAEKQAYQIINKDDGRVLAYNTSGASDTALVTRNDQKPEHYWTLEDAGDGNVLLVNYANKKKVLDVYGEKTAGGSRLYVQDKLTNSNAQKFKLVKLY
ncbi:insecticidal delta-endotoxin Cry8Ea1 family protein [Bacillus thuringiensis]